MIALSLGLSWILIGPPFIWRYERYTLIGFLKGVRKICIEKDDFLLIKKDRVHTGTKIEDLRRYFDNLDADRELWILLFTRFRFCIWNIRIQRCFLLGFWSRVSNFFILHWSRFLPFVQNDASCANPCSDDDKSTDLSRAQNKFGLSFIGDFALQTSSMFFSGWLFAPVIFLISQYGPNRNYIIPILLLGAYTTYTIVAFAWPVIVIRNKIREEKKKLRAKHAKVANKLLTNLDRRFLVGEWKHFRLQDSLLSSINSVGEWPLNLDVIIKFASSSIIYPLLASLVSAYLKRINYSQIQP